MLIRQFPLVCVTRLKPTDGIPSVDVLEGEREVRFDLRVRFVFERLDELCFVVIILRLVDAHGPPADGTVYDHTIVPCPIVRQSNPRDDP